MNLLQYSSKLIEHFPFDYWTKRLVDLPVLLKWAKLRRGASLLELGCGQGNISRYLSKKLKCQQYTAIDLSPQMIARAESRTHEDTKIIFQVADVCKLPFDDESFDAVISIDLLHHVSNWKKGIREISRVLKKNGKLLIRDFSIESFTVPGIGFIIQNFFEHPYDNMYDQVELLTYIRKNGFTITHQNEIPWLLLLAAVKQ